MSYKKCISQFLSICFTSKHLLIIYFSLILVHSDNIFCIVVSFFYLLKITVWTPVVDFGKIAVWTWKNLYSVFFECCIYDNNVDPVKLIIQISCIHTDFYFGPLVLSVTDLVKISTTQVYLPSSLFSTVGFALYVLILYY